MASKSAGEQLKFQTWSLKVSIHCQGCKKKVKKLIQAIDGVYTTDIDSQHHKVTVTGVNIDADTLVKKLTSSGKHAQLWPDQNNNNNNKSKKGGDGTTASDHDAQNHPQQKLDSIPKTETHTNHINEDAARGSGPKNKNKKKKGKNGNSNDSSGGLGSPAELVEEPVPAAINPSHHQDAFPYMPMYYAPLPPAVHYNTTYPTDTSHIYAYPPPLSDPNYVFNTRNSHYADYSYDYDYDYDDDHPGCSIM
ncbi:Heavy metal transport/detoxification superfamily protein [Euphorbia peplus]|nr:Heavy metal transport/detoxification superfamily protein [Euphorbia peplus]